MAKNKLSAHETALLHVALIALATEVRGLNPLGIIADLAEIEELKFKILKGI